MRHKLETDLCLLLKKVVRLFVAAVNPTFCQRSPETSCPTSCNKQKRHALLVKPENKLENFAGIRAPVGPTSEKSWVESKRDRHNCHTLCECFHGLYLRIALLGI